MSIWEKEDWIKDILSKSGTEIQEVNTNNEIRKMVYYTALPLIMQTENGGGGSSQLCLSPNNSMDAHNPHHQPSPSSNLQMHQFHNLQQQPQHIINLSNNGGGAGGGGGTSSAIMLQLDQQQQQQQQQLHHNQPSSSYSVQIIPNNNKTMLLGGQQPVQAPQQQQQQPAQNSKFKCEQCNMCFGSKSAHTSHMKSHAVKQYQAPVPAPSPPSNSADPYQCDVCKKTFAVPARLVRHYRTHTGERPFECEFCHKMFSVKENLQVHRRIHTKERPYKCDVCSRAFEHSGKLHRHMRIHTGERPHKCSICAKTFIQSGQLVIHMRTHTGEKPYKCPVEGCGKGFTCSKQLKVHSRTHTGEKPYHCDICFRDFGYNHVLKLHRVQHYGSKCYKCTICDETFKSKKEMEAHIKGHANEMPDDEDMPDEETDTVDDAEPMINPSNIKLENGNQRSEELMGKGAVALAQQQQQQHHQPPSDHELNMLLQTDARKISPPALELSLSPPQLNDSLNDLSCYNMYSRFEQSVVNNYGIHSGVNPALLAAASIAASATPAQINGSNMCSTLSSPSSNMSIPNGNEDLSRSHSPINNGFVYEPLAGIMRQHFFVPAPQAPEFKPSVLASDTLRRVEAALAGTETLLTPPRSSPESPDRDSSSPESDSVIMANRDNNTLPPRKRRLYFKDNQQNPNDSNTTMRVSSVIQYAKAS